MFQDELGEEIEEEQHRIELGLIDHSNARKTKGEFREFCSNLSITEFEWGIYPPSMMPAKQHNTTSYVANMASYAIS
jgi:hypothetical protein